jgi:CubicO group peptidase (beta-lactamase class C family)
MNTGKAIISLVILLLVSFSLTLAQVDSVDTFVLTEMANRRIPGLALAVIQNGALVKVKGYGLANIELDVPVTPQIVFQSGSVGKQFTATAIMQLVEEGKLRLDDRLTKYFPQSPDSWRDITVRHLLTHTSGIPDWETDSTVINLRNDYTEGQLLHKAMSLRLDFQPGERWSYSNTGYVVLGILIHHVAGKFYGDVLRERVFQPLAMETTRIISEADIVPNRAAGYRLVDGDLKNQEWVSPSLNTTADGSLYLSILDLVKWDAGLNTEKILKKSSLEQMWTPVRLKSDSLHPYGFGWDLSSVNGRKAIRHSGSWQGFNSYIARFVDDKLSIIVLVNRNRANPGRIAQGVAGFYVPVLAPRIFIPVVDTDPALTAFVRELHEEPDTVSIRLEAFAAEYQPKVKAFLVLNKEFMETFGNVRSVVLVASKKESDSQLARYRVSYKAGSRLVVVSRNKQGKINGVNSTME